MVTIIRLVARCLFALWRILFIEKQMKTDRKKRTLRKVCHRFLFALWHVYLFRFSIHLFLSHVSPVLNFAPLVDMTWEKEAIDVFVVDDDLVSTSHCSIQSSSLSLSLKCRQFFNARRRSERINSHSTLLIMCYQ